MTDMTIDPRAGERRGAPLGATLAPLVGRSWAKAFAHFLGLGKCAEVDPVSRAEREAAEVRELALRYRDTDRGFAYDLFVAADRHENEARARRPQ